MESFQGNKLSVRYLRYLLAALLEACFNLYLAIEFRCIVDNSRYTPWAKEYLLMRGAGEEDIAPYEDRRIRAEAMRGWQRFKYKGYFRELITLVRGQSNGG